MEKIVVRLIKAVAEGVGFEPTIPGGIPVFKTGAIVHSAIPPELGCRNMVRSKVLSYLERALLHAIQAFSSINYIRLTPRRIHISPQRVC